LKNNKEELMEENKNLEIEQLRQQLKQQEKLASLGTLSAGIAHEIQNPLNFVINFSKMSDKLLSDLSDIVADNEDKLWDVTIRNGFSAQDGCLGHSGNDGDCVFAWVHSRKSNGKTLVSSQLLINANSILSQYQGDLAFNLAKSSYGEGRSAFLTPNGEATGNTASGGGNSGDNGGGNGGGGNDSL
jgi:hypothetical protein